MHCGPKLCFGGRDEPPKSLYGKHKVMAGRKEDCKQHKFSEEWTMRLESILYTVRVRTLKEDTVL